MTDALRIARRLQAIAQTGLTFSRDPYDRERYEEIRRLSMELLSDRLERPAAELAALYASDTGYPTPRVDVRAVVFDADGRLLFVRETTDGLWCLPGGWCDQGQSPGQAAAAEVEQESGYLVRPAKILAVWDRERQGMTPSLHSVYKLFVRCELEGGAPRTSIETSAVGFFAADEVPPLSLPRITPAQVARMFAHRDHPDWPADFD